MTARRTKRAPETRAHAIRAWMEFLDWVEQDLLYMTGVTAVDDVLGPALAACRLLRAQVVDIINLAKALARCAELFIGAREHRIGADVVDIGSVTVYAERALNHAQRALAFVNRLARVRKGADGHGATVDETIHLRAPGSPDERGVV